MKSTALGAENIIFISDAHEKFVSKYSSVSVFSFFILLQSP